MEKIVDKHDNHICLFCGKEMKEQLGSRDEDYASFYECNCPAIKRNKEIDSKIADLKSKIRNLKDSRHKPKFEIVKQHVLKRVENVI